MLQKISSFRRRNRSAEEGISLIEMLIYLAIAASIVIFGLVLGKKLFASNHIDNATSQMATYVDAVQALGKANGGFQWLSSNGGGDSNLYSAGKISSKTPDDPWGGAITVDPANVLGGTNNGFYVTFADVPANDCAQLVGNVVGNSLAVGIGNNILSDNYSGQSFATADGTVSGSAVAFSPATAASDCGGGSGSGVTNITVFSN